MVFQKQYGGGYGSQDLLDYNQLLLQHLNKISSLTSKIPGEFVDSKQSIGWKETDKLESFEWMVQFFEAIIPPGLKDEEYGKRKGRLSELPQQTPTQRMTYYMRFLYILIDLLERRGRLYEQRGGAKIPKSKIPKKILEESVIE